MRPYAQLDFGRRRDPDRHRPADRHRSLLQHAADARMEEQEQTVGRRRDGHVLRRNPGPRLGGQRRPRLRIAGRPHGGTRGRSVRNDLHAARSGCLLRLDFQPRVVRRAAARNRTRRHHPSRGSGGRHLVRPLPGRSSGRPARTARPLHHHIQPRLRSPASAVPPVGVVRGRESRIQRHLCRPAQQMGRTQTHRDQRTGSGRPRRRLDLRRSGVEGRKAVRRAVRSIPAARHAPQSAHPARRHPPGGRSGPHRTAPRRTRRRKHPAGMEHLARGASAGRKARRPRRDAHSAQCRQLHHTRQTLAAQRSGPFDALFQRTDQRAGFQLRDDLRRRLRHPARPLQHGLEQMELSGREHQNRAGAPQRAGEQAARQRTAPRRGRPGRAAALGDRPLRAGQQGQCADP